MNITIGVEKDNYILRFAYNKSLISAIKTLPMHTRSWDGNRQVWVVHKSSANELRRIMQTYVPDVELPKIEHNAEQEIRDLRIAYIGQCRDKNGESSASAVLLDEDCNVGTEWNIIIPEKVLRKWFGEENLSPNEQHSLFGVLGVRRDADETEIRAGFRRMAKIWHPDINKDPEAQEQFLRVQEAWSILGDEKKREKYIAGLAFSAGTAAAFPVAYRPPVQYGLIKAKGTEQARRFVVDDIISWDKIYDKDGAYLVSVWNTEKMEVRTHFIRRYQYE